MKKLSVFVMVVLSWGIALGQNYSDTTAVKEKIKETSRKIAKLKKTITKESGRYAKYRTATQKRITRRRYELTRAASDKDSLDILIRERRTKLQSTERRIKETNLRFKSINKSIKKKALEFKRMIQDGFPFEKEKRISPLELLIRDIDQGDIGPEEAFNRLWIICNAEQQFGTQCEIASPEVTLPQGQTIPVKMLRIGKQFLAYTSVDEDRYGLLKISINNTKRSYKWVHSNLDFKVRRAIKAAIEIKEGKRPPGLVVLPVSIHAITGKEK